MKANTIEELFGTLQQSIVAEWRKHLKTSKYSKHMALDEFYKEMPELVDALIEEYNGHNKVKVEEFTNILKAEDYDALQYLEELHEICQSGYDLLGDVPELKSDLDAIKSKIDSVMYKLRELKESRQSLRDFITESIVESRGAAIKDRTYRRFNADHLANKGEKSVLDTAIEKAIDTLSGEIDSASPVEEICLDNEIDICINTHSVEEFILNEVTNRFDIRNNHLNTAQLNALNRMGLKIDGGLMTATMTDQKAFVTHISNILLKESKKKLKYEIELFNNFTKSWEDIVIVPDEALKEMIYTKPNQETIKTVTDIYKKSIELFFNILRSEIARIF